MSEGKAWAEQEAIDEWWDDHQRELKVAVSRARIDSERTLASSQARVVDLTARVVVLEAWTRNRDSVWCRALVACLSTDDVQKVTAEFNRLRPDVEEGGR